MIILYFITGAGITSLHPYLWLPTARVFGLAAELGRTARKHTSFLRVANYVLEFIDFAFLWRICLPIVSAAVHQGDEAARSPLAPGEIVQI